MTPEQLKQQYQEEAEKLYPDEEHYEEFDRWIADKITRKQRKAYITGSLRSSEELSKLQRELDTLKKENEWISVEDRLPEVDALVWIFDGQFVYQAKFLRDVGEYGLLWLRKGNYTPQYHLAKYWMSFNVPSPPEH